MQTAALLRTCSFMFCNMSKPDRDAKAQTRTYYLERNFLQQASV